MKNTRHLCDFCGGRIKASDKFAMLTVPLTKEEMGLKKRTAKKPSEDVRENPFLMMFVGVDEPTSQTYDMCRECARGLLSARIATVSALRRAIGIK